MKILMRGIIAGIVVIIFAVVIWGLFLVNSLYKEALEGLLM
jgi:hypothetical protein